MAPPAPVLPRERLHPYRPDVPRQPKNFRIDSVSIEPLPPKAYVPTGPDSAVPARFEAHFTLGVPEAAVTIEVFVPGNQGPIVLDLAIRGKAQTPITTSILRQVLVDQLLQKAVAEATVHGSVRTEWLSSLPIDIQETPQQADSQPESKPSAEERARIQFDEDARTAAQLYSEAIASGSRSPTIAVAEAMNRSRSQAARYVRRARALGLLEPA